MLKRLLRRLLLLAISFAAAVWLLSVYRETQPPPPLSPITGQIDRIVIEKAARQMMLYQNDIEIRRYKIALGFAPDGDKQQQGDGKTPEGLFRINRRNPDSAYHLSLGLDYPRPADRARAAASGVSPGGDIFIHGQPNRIAGLMTLPYDWTEGCIAVSDKEIAEIWRVTPIGTTVEIRP